MLAIANTIIKPILTLLTLPLVIITLGLFLFAINVAMLALAEWIAPDFSIDGFWTVRRRDDRRLVRQPRAVRPARPPRELQDAPGYASQRLNQRLCLRIARA